MAASVQTSEQLPAGWKSTVWQEFAVFMKKECGWSIPIEQVPLPLAATVESELDDEDDVDPEEETRRAYNKRNRNRAIELLLAGTSVKKTAELIGVSRKTVHEWMKRPDFAAELESRTTQIMERSNYILQSATVDVSAALVSIALNAAMDPADRIRAASKILDIAHGISTLKNAKELLEQIKSGDVDADASTSKSTFTRSEPIEISSNTA